MHTRSIHSTFTVIALLGFAAGCGDDNDGPSSAATATATRPAATATGQPTVTAAPTSTQLPIPTPTGTGRLDISVCAPDAGPFSNTIDHPFFPLPVGAQWVLEGENEEGALVRLEITSLDETQTLAGVVTRVVEERELEDDELIEVARNYFVRAPDGTLCYYGEDVDFYEDGEIVSHDGTWHAGENGALPGILIPAQPALGQVFQQESAPGIAEDEATIVATGETVEVPLGTFTDTIRFEELNPLDGGTSVKTYARGTGLLVDDEFARTD
jgi:hypothetical protein